ncbi:acyltransferase [Enterobacterales bacterium AW_CKDN230030176-1A_HGKHYDSX7]
MTTHVLEVRGRCQREPWRLSGLDRMVESWADYLLVYPYCIEGGVFAEHLAKALDLNPYFAGRKMTLDQGMVVSGGNEGARLEQVRIPGRLPDGVLMGRYDQIDPFCDRTRREQHRRSKTSLKQPLLQIRLSVFDDATVIGFSVWHGLSDGTTFFEFLERLAECCQGRDMPMRLPVFEPFRAAPGAVPEGALVDRWQYPEAVQQSPVFAEGAFTLHEADIDRLLEGCVCPGFMRQDYLIGYVWRLIVMTDTLEAGERTALYPVYDARQLMDMSPAQVGNLLCYPTVALRAGQVREAGLAELASYIRDAATARVLDSDTLQEELQAICAQVESGGQGRYLLQPLYESLYGHSVLFNNLTGMPWQRFDLGQGAPVHVDAPMHDPLRFVQFFPCLSRPGALTVKVNLPESHLQRFRDRFNQELQP